MTLTLKIEYPDNLPDFLQKSRQEFESEARMALAVKLFEMKRISSGMAAKMVKMDRKTFLMKLHEYNVPVIDLEEDELLSDFENV